MKLKFEVRNPKSERSPKSEARNPDSRTASRQPFRISDLRKPGLQQGRTTVTLLVVLATFLIMAALAWYVQFKTRPAPVDVARVAERKKFLAEVRAAESQALNNYGWVDQSKGLVRLPIRRAMDLVLEEWKHPAAAHSNMAARAEKAFAPPPVAPVAPNPFE